VYGNAADQPERQRRYPTDMTDAEWTEVRPLLPLPGWMRGRGGRPEGYCHRAILDAIRFVVDNGIKWRAMPADFPPWDRVYAFFRRWHDNALVRKFHDRLRARVREKLGRGPAFSRLVSLAVAVILYDAGLGLDLARLKGHIRRVVVRLLWIGVLITWLLAALLAVPLLGMSRPAAVMIGAILVVSGPTVVGPLLSFVLPKDRLRHILIWAGSLTDPVGGVLGALVFHAVSASAKHRFASGAGGFLVSVGVGVAGGVIGAALLWVLFRVLRLGEVLGTTTQLAAVIGVAALCDVLRDDKGLIAADQGLEEQPAGGDDGPGRRQLPRHRRPRASV
jgi:transposase